MIAFLIATVLVCLVIIGGVVVNLYLYSQGAVGKRSSRHIPGDGEEDIYYATVGASEDVTGMYVRRALLTFLGIACLTVVVLAFLLTHVPR